MSTLFCPSTLLLLFLLIVQTIASPFDLVKWIDNTLPHRGKTLRDELQCYALPLGGLGFTSHVITYYTIVMLSRGRSPWLLKKNTHWRFDICLAVLSLVWTLLTTIFTMIRCRQRWEFVVMAFWKMTMSLTLSAIGAHAAVIVRRQLAWTKKSKGVEKNVQHSSNTSRGETELLALQKLRRPHRQENTEEQEELGPGSPKDISPGNVLLWTSLYFIGIVVGYCGLFSLVRQSWHIQDVRNFTIVYAIFTSVFIFSGIMIGIDIGDGAGGSIMGIAFLIIGTGMLAAIYSDWILGAIAGKYAGVPDGNNAVLYWSYFAAKRLPFVSF